MEMLFFRYWLEKIQKLMWGDNQKYGSYGNPKSSNLCKQQITQKNVSNIIFCFSLYYWLIPCTFVNKKTEGIILSKYSPQTVASDEL